MVTSVMPPAQQKFAPEYISQKNNLKDIFESDDDEDKGGLFDKKKKGGKNINTILSGG